MNRRTPVGTPSGPGGLPQAAAAPEPALTPLQRASAMLGSPVSA
ncbi:hypothetical protein [Streptomyces goshikiensis]